MSTTIALVSHQTSRHQIDLHATVATRFATVEPIRSFYLVLVGTFLAFEGCGTVIDDVFAVAGLALDY
jgi:hypothetical protein